MELITVEEMDSLPDDPSAGFVPLERICRTRLMDVLQRADRDDDMRSLRHDYMTIVSAAAQQYGIVVFEQGEGDEYSEENFERVRRKAIGAATRLGLGLKSRRALNTVALPDGSKARLRKHLADLQTALDKAELPEKKLARLRAKLHDFAGELDKDRSNLTRILAGIAVVAAVLPHAEDGVIKLPNAINAMLVLIGREKLEEEENTPPAIALPPTVERKALPAPAKKPAFLNAAFDDLDDDVPF